MAWEGCVRRCSRPKAVSDTVILSQLGTRAGAQTRPWAWSPGPLDPVSCPSYSRQGWGGRRQVYSGLGRMKACCSEAWERCPGLPQLSLRRHGGGFPRQNGTELVPPHFAGPPALFPEAWAQVSCLAENAQMLSLGGLGSVTPTEDAGYRSRFSP